MGKKKPSKDLSHEEHLTDSCGPLGDQLLFAKVRNGICGRVAGMKETLHKHWKSVAVGLMGGRGLQRKEQ